MKRAILTFLMAFSISAPNVSWGADCPPKPVGIYAETNSDLHIFYATSKDKALLNDPGSHREAVSRARLKALDLLKLSKDVPKTASGALRGIKTVSVCETSGNVFITLAADKESFDAASIFIDQLKSRADGRLEGAPEDDETETDFKEFLK